MRVVPVPVLDDNYAYLLIAKDNTAAAVDPVEPEKLLAAAKSEGVTINTVLTTHKHWDHAGGNNEFKKREPQVEIIGGINDMVEGQTRPVAHGEEFQLGSASLRAIETPFHTGGHICYLCKEEGSEDLVFTGDTLFVGGCGRCFTGNTDHMYESLIGKLAKLPPQTVVYCGHEYTVANLKFAAHADPDNEAVQKKLAWAQEQRRQNLPTIPSSIGEELAINPFLRPDAPALKKFTGLSDPRTVLAAVRKAKDQF